MTGSIDKQEAIKLVADYLYNLMSPRCIGLTPDHCWKEAEDILAKAPPAEPEPLTDKEQRIFLAAMAREEKVCRQVDDEYRNCREPYEDSLVRTCHEITRKVKGALWTI